MFFDKDTASVFAEQLADTNENTQDNDNTIRPMTTVERQRTIEGALQNGNITQEQATALENFFTPEDGLNLIPANTIDPEPIDWIWNGHVASGKLQILAGVPGTGKTTLALNFAAIVSSGGMWPDGTKCEPGNVLIWSGEDDIKDTLTPRLIAAKAERSNIHFIGDVIYDSTESRSFDLAKDIHELLKKVKEIGNVKLIIIDPIVHAVTRDSHKNNDVRNALKPIVELAAKVKAAVLGITHFSKGTYGKAPLDRVTGSLAFGAVPRVVLVTEKESVQDGAKYILARAKSNLGHFDGGFYYEIEANELPDFPGIVTAKITWLGEAEGTVQQLLSRESGSTIKISKLDKAKYFLLSLLSNGDVCAEAVSDCAERAGISITTLNRAKKELSICSKRFGYSNDGDWVWSLDSKDVN